MGNLQDRWGYQRIKLKPGSKIEGQNSRKMSVYDQDPLSSPVYMMYHHKITLSIHITGQLMSLHIQDYRKMCTDVLKDHVLSTVIQCRDQCCEYHQVVFPATEYGTSFETYKARCFFCEFWFSPQSLPPHHHALLNLASVKIGRRTHASFSTGEWLRKLNLFLDSSTMYIFKAPG